MKVLKYVRKVRERFFFYMFFFVAPHLQIDFDLHLQKSHLRRHLSYRVMYECEQFAGAALQMQSRIKMNARSSGIVMYRLSN